MSTAPKSDWWILVVAMATIAVLAVAEWCGFFGPATFQSAVLAGTALIILWYTIETTRLRREAEARATRDREPRIYFDVQQPHNELSALRQTTGPREFLGQGGKHVLRFNIVNYSPNSALACVRARLGVDSQVGIFPPDSDYGGGVVWRITPFFDLSGWFNLMELVQKAQEGLGRDAWPDGPLVLSLQVDLYLPNRQLLESSPKEYHVRVDAQKCTVEFWPKVNVSLGVLECPRELPTGLTLRAKEASA